MTRDARAMRAKMRGRNRVMENYDWRSIDPLDQEKVEMRNDWIEIWTAEGESTRKIARRIGRSKDAVTHALRQRKRRRERQRELIERQQREIAERIAGFEAFCRLPGLRIIEAEND